MKYVKENVTWAIASLVFLEDCFVCPNKANKVA